jgi:hypothetical protein
MAILVLAAVAVATAEPVQPGKVGQSHWDCWEDHSWSGGNPVKTSIYEL